jgi:DNA-binding NarL/FixJ family response regulator
VLQRRVGRDHQDFRAGLCTLRAGLCARYGGWGNTEGCPVAEIGSHAVTIPDKQIGPRPWRPSELRMKLLLVDDHPLILTALKAVIESVNDRVLVQGVGTAAAARAAMQQGDDIDLVLLDLSLGDDDGFALLGELRTTYPSIPVVVVSASERISDVIRCIDLGAMGFIPKSTAHADLHEALRMVMTGSMYVPPSMLGLDFARLRAQAAEEALQSAAGSVGSGLGSGARAEPHQQIPSMEQLGLTPRQAEVLGLLLQGLPNKLIARELNLSVETVKDHVAAVLRALNVSSRTQAVLAVSQMTQGQGGFQARRPVARG